MITNLFNNIIMANLHILPNYDIRTKEQYQTDDQTKTELSDNLKLTVHSLFIFPENLDIIISESQRT